MKKLTLVLLFSALLFMTFVANSNFYPITVSLKVFASNGDIIIGGDEIFEIKNGEYVIKGNVIVKDNGVLIIENSTLILGESYFNITIKDNGNLTVINSILDTNALWNDVYFLDNAVVEMKKVTIEGEPIIGGGIYLHSYNNSKVHISDSIIKTDFNLFGNSTSVIVNSHFIDLASPRVYDNSSLWVLNTVIDHKIYVYGSSKVKVQHSILGTYMDVHDSSSVLIFDQSILKGGIVCDGNAVVEIWNSTTNDVTTYGWSYVRVSNSVVKGHEAAEGLISHDYSSIEVFNSDISEVESQHHSSILLTNSSIDYSVNAYDMSTINLLNTTYGWIKVEDYAKVDVAWYLTVYTFWNNSPISNATIEIYYTHNGSLVQKAFSNPNGMASFLLKEKIVYSDATLFVGNYTIRITYENLTEIKNVILTSGMEMIVVIPELSFGVVLLSCLTAVLGVTLLRQKRKKSIYRIYTSGFQKD